MPPKPCKLRQNERLTGFAFVTVDKLGKHILTLFTVIALILLILGQAWEADFVAIYGTLASLAFLIILQLFF